MSFGLKSIKLTSSFYLSFLIQCQALFPRRTYLGCDPAADAIRLANKHFPHITFVVADLLDHQSLPRVKADASVVRGVIHHIPNPEQSFTSTTLTRWIRNGGAEISNVCYVGLVPFFCPKQLIKPLKRIEPFIERSPLAPLLCAQIIIEVEKTHGR